MRTIIVLGMLLAGCYAFSDQMMSLEQLAKLDIHAMDCSHPNSEFLQIKHQMKQWSDLLSHQDYITHDIKVLKHMITMLEKGDAFLQVQVSLQKQLFKQIKSLKLPHTKSKIGLVQLKALKESCHDLDNEDARKELCRLLREYVGSLQKCKQQCHSAPITVIKIKGQIKDIEIIRAGCKNGNGIQVIADGKVVSQEKQEKVEKVDAADEQAI